jgi:fructose-1-phosphate kinase PfkB-like protein
MQRWCATRKRAVCVVWSMPAAPCCALRGLRAAGVEMPLLSLGAQGAVMAAGDNCLQAVAPHIDAVNPVGSGDCMLAGIAHALARGDDPVQALALGVACGSANALQEDTGRIAAATVVDLLARVQINTLSSSIPSNTRRQDWRRSATS